MYRYGQISKPDELNFVDASVRRYAREAKYDGPYVVTDCDIDLREARSDALRIYVEMLDRFGRAECVGPMLKIADIPTSYPLFNYVMERHIAQFWRRQPDWADLRIGRVAYLAHKIDTTFAVHRAGSTFRRLKTGLRLYHPFEARHLDWYVSDDDKSEYRATSAPAVSHWDNEVGFDRHRSKPDQAQTYRIVTGVIGDLRVATRSTLDHPS